MKTYYTPSELAEMFWIFENGSFKKGISSDMSIVFEGLDIETGEMRYRSSFDGGYVKSLYPMQTSKLAGGNVELTYMIRYGETETMARIAVPDAGSDVKTDDSFQRQMESDTADDPKGSQGDFVNLYLLAGLAMVGFLLLRKRQ